jgi:hypothetical protein
VSAACRCMVDVTAKATDDLERPAARRLWIRRWGTLEDRALPRQPARAIPAKAARPEGPSR